MDYVIKNIFETIHRFIGSYLICSFNLDMNIAIFTNNYFPNPYGVTGSVESFRKEFEKRGHTVYIFAPKYKEYIDKNPNACLSGRQVFRYPSLDIKFKIRFPLAIPYSRRMDEIIKNLDLDIVHSQHPNLLGSVAAKWARNKKIPLIFTWHTLYNYYAHFAKIVPKHLAAWYIIRKAVKYADSADAVIVPTDSVIPIIKNWGVTNKNIFAVATGVEEREFEGADGKNIRKKYGVADDETLLLMVSRLTSEKNIDFVMKAVKSVLASNKKVKFMLVGGGNLLEDLKKDVLTNKLENRIIFVGEVLRECRKDYFAAGDIFVYGSKSETQGMIISEAMYVGLPIIAVNATGIKSLVLNNGNGFLVSENEEEFANAVKKLIADKNLRDKFGEVSRRIARTQFTSKVCAEKMLEVYDNAIGNYSK